MSTSEKFCLKWNDFQENISTTFGSLRKDYDFVDVTLACEDGQQVDAHKFILAAASPFFQNLLSKNKHAHPLIYMRGIKSDDLIAIVDFLYHGEANIYQENLDSFLVIAEELKLKGLTGGSSPELKSEENYTPQPIIKQTKRTQPKEMEMFPKKEFPSETFIYESETFNERSVALQNEIFAGGLKELDEKIRSMWVLTKKDGASTYVCQVCGKEGRVPSQIRDHIEAHHIEGVSHPCNFCEKTFRSRGVLGMHKHRHHKS